MYQSRYGVLIIVVGARDRTREIGMALSVFRVSSGTRCTYQLNSYTKQSGMAVRLLFYEVIPQPALG
jgi:hypothetical protein